VCGGRSDEYRRANFPRRKARAMRTDLATFLAADHICDAMPVLEIGGNSWIRYRDLAKTYAEAA
jgi:hypothetical protein